MSALKQPTIRVVAIIAEGVPESDTKQMIAYAKSNNKVVIGPATVGGIQAGAFKIGDTAGTIDNIIQCKLYRPGSVGFVTKSVSTLWSLFHQDFVGRISRIFHPNVYTLLIPIVQLNRSIIL
ncbi:ATP-citrate synthase beta chain protein 1-like [Capsicum annuum]|uniref:ATP-citrate synthase beta chain protein 1-like n=1 Tax=Capsicum annuum TaxID=4072 RepID=UPI001FB0E458|nr:ATP-citrate synthase beta chain protein 1-like [Capsicum annuum]